MDLKNEAGYTLVESLVAMTIFVSVLIPLATAIGNVLFLSDTSHERKALHLAQSEIAKVCQSAQTANTEVMRDGFLIAIKSEQIGRLIQITAIVSKTESSKPLAVLHKAILVE